MTRIERQIGGQRIPSQLENFGQLASAAAFDPFEAIEIVANAFPLPDPARYGESETVKLLGLHALIQELGFHGARAYLNLNGNAARLFERYAHYLEANPAVRDLTREAIFAEYDKSTEKQIGNMKPQSISDLERCATLAP
jgi:hypothetical protein